MKTLIPTFLLLFTTFLPAFSQTVLNNQFKFKDGIYLNYEDFKNNDPSISLEEIILYYSDKEYGLYIRHLEAIKYKDGQPIDRASIWGMCENGIPYISNWIHEKGVFSNDVILTKIGILGAICHFTMPINYTRNYFDKKKKRYTYGSINKTQRIFKFNDGEVLFFDVENFQKLITDDAELSKLLEKEKRKPKKIFLYLKKYNERNIVTTT